MTRAGVALVLVAGGCTFDAGEGFATVEPGRLEVSLEGGGALTTDLGYDVAVTAFTVDTTYVALDGIALAAGASDAHCHGGGCGAEPAAAEREEMAVLFARAGGLDVLSGAVVELVPRAPPYLPRAEILSARVVLEHLQLTAQASGGALGARSITLEVLVDEPVIGIVFAGETDLDVTEDGPAHLTPQVSLVFTARALDGLDFATLAGAGATLRLSSPPAAVVTLETEEAHAHE